VDDLLIVGLIILVGFVGRILYKYTKIPESVFMIVIGLLIGPVLQIVDRDLFLSYEQLILTVTLVIVLLDSGLSMNVFDTARNFGKALGFTLLVLVTTTATVGYVMYLAGWPVLHALLMGVLSSGTTTLVAVSLLPRLGIPDKIKQILYLESIINDSTLVTAAVIIIQVIGVGSFDPSLLVAAFAVPLVTAIALGIGFTVLWINVLWNTADVEGLSYVFTIGVLFVLYALVEALNGNGAIAILVTSLCFGNFPVILGVFGEYPPGTTVKYGIIKFNPRRFHVLRERFATIVERMKRSQIDFGFFIQNFFFVYLGLSFDLTIISPTLIGLCTVLLLLMFVSRFVSAQIMGFVDGDVRRYASLMSVVVARGFTATFVALLPSTQGIVIPFLKEIILIMVVLSTLVTILGLIIHERSHHDTVFDSSVRAP
jgi:NhaP-type Na+/H+ or K+/H+ antiporter